ncbi:DAZ-associated protein 2-like isoform X2 [Bombyx mandarina]|uniref:DAZ-associated protein 2 n=1 Tax=Bombyx mandarina TaxID=7092 RepID=A0A6J2KPA5_BOMMA|nr:DAZ-associated protein 2-like isoform X2 [Bombyx mandarina]
MTIKTSFPNGTVPHAMNATITFAGRNTRVVNRNWNAKVIVAVSAVRGLAGNGRVALRDFEVPVVPVTPPLGAYPQPQPPQGPFLPAPPHQAAPQYGVAGGSPYGVTFGGAGAGAGGVYAPPPYEQLQHHQAIPALSQQLPMYSPAAAMYAAAAAGYPGYIGYPVQYYPYYPAVQPSIQPLRPTIMIPNGFEAGGRFEGLAQSLLPPAPPGVPPSPAHLAALQPHQVLWR